ncbi:Transmembrane 45B isoform B [Chlorella sorokiniana]|uniref:Transmembrane 45B isoform B n=1 Tax=Chlorella sorokiniana TaxID=3076 RepID=A0A2P6TKZ6_CHLSO|nr:Transmembrane 45B isoform B [Chlorella sorokiniana]|eukprot:PRW44954.1 Transmembrane 45B isoform B [Chlorella sorokiniana]
MPGHFYPGLIFCLWGSWWAYNTAAYYLWASPRRPFKGRAWFPLAGRWARLAEPILKLLVPAVAISFELFLDHNMEWQFLYCPKGTKYEGRFAMTHMNNWQHTASYPGVVLSGLVDLLALVVPLPSGTGQAVLGVGWSCMAFIMVLHEKHEPQDKMVHWLLFVNMALVAIMLFVDLAVRQRNVLVGMGKSLAVIFQGAWLIQIAAVEFEHHPQWSTEYPGGAMMAPVAFTSILLAALAAMLLFYCLMYLGKQHGLLTPARLGLPLDDKGDQQGYVKPGEMLPSPGLDSARHSDGDDDSDVLLLEAGGRMAPFQIMHPRGAAKDTSYA